MIKKMFILLILVCAISGNIFAVKCKNGHENLDDASYCSECRTKIRCEQCNSQLPSEEYNYCPMCGKNFSFPVAASTPDVKTFFLKNTNIFTLTVPSTK